MENMDTQVRSLIDLVNEQEKEIKKASNPEWKTNCVFRNENITKNIRSISNVKDVIHFYKLILNDNSMHNRACVDLGIDYQYMFNGFSLEDWKNDFTNIINSITLNDKKKKLNTLKSKLDSLISEDERKRIELENIKKELGV
jgi:flagellin-specific chaperone FliS